MTVNKKWQDEDRDIIRRGYRHNRESVERLMVQFGVSRQSILGQVAYMGLARKDLRKPWSDEEKERLRELIPTYCPRRVALKMHRSINSVVVMSKRLKVYRRHRNGWYTKREVMEICGVDHRVVQSWMDNGSLPASPHYDDSKPGQKGGSAWHINEGDLAHFIRKYPEELHGRNMDIIQIVEILVGLEM